MREVLIELECEDCQLKRTSTVHLENDQELARHMASWNMDAMSHANNRDHQILVSALVKRHS